MWKLWLSTLWKSQRQRQRQRRRDGQKARLCFKQNLAFIIHFHSSNEKFRVVSLLKTKPTNASFTVLSCFIHLEASYYTTVNIEIYIYNI